VLTEQGLKNLQRMVSMGLKTYGHAECVWAKIQNGEYQLQSSK
jgi:hypothetical protein